jgi:hypothetical protein
MRKRDIIPGLVPGSPYSEQYYLTRRLCQRLNLAVKGAESAKSLPMAEILLLPFTIEEAPYM